MPDFRVSPISIVNQIKSNLQDRYDSGYPVLKELLQNADDAGARRFRLDALPGWRTAANPLLRGPGLLVVNDGEFRKDDERGIISFGESGKATDSAAIGKFGLGQKAVFHLCDAFVVYAYGGNEPFSTVVNPFLGVDVDGNVSRQWEPPSANGLVETDLKLLRLEVSANFPDGCLALWLPFRREGLRPATGVGFSSNFPSASGTIAELANPDDLRVLLTALRHLESVDIVGRPRGATEHDPLISSRIKRGTLTNRGEEEKWLNPGRAWSSSVEQGLLSAEHRGKALRLAISKRQRIVRGDLVSLRCPSPAVGIAPEAAGPRLHFDKDEANRRENEGIDFIDTSFVVDELEVRPCAPRLVVGQMFAQEVQRFPLPLESRLADRRPTSWSHRLVYQNPWNL
jgi:hypothetical protein